MKNIYAWLVLIVAACVSMPAQATGKESSQSARRYINLTNLVQGPFSDGVLVGNTLYLADQIGIDPNTGKLPDDVGQEARIALDRMKSILAEAGMTMDDLVFVQVFCTDMSLYPKFNEVYKTYFVKDYPARTFVGSGSGPSGRGAHFEINGIAVKR
jgi:2-iminobutanoate/2-iminopropanoate deaminase